MPCFYVTFMLSTHIIDIAYQDAEETFRVRENLGELKTKTLAKAKLRFF